MKHLDVEKEYHLEILSEMNTYDRVLLDNTFDYDVVIPACYKFNTTFVMEWDLRILEPFMNHYFLLLTDKELSLRMAAIAGF